MAQIELQAADSKKTRRKFYPSIRIDMTPMVDLGFLLITFFIFTTTMSESKAMKLLIPHDGPPIPAPQSKVLTVLLEGNNKVYAYEGKFEEAIKENRIVSTTYDEGDGIGNLIRQKQKQLQAIDKKDGRNSLIYLIKPTKQCSYKNVVDALDETMINDVKKYMVVNPSVEEIQQLQKLNQRVFN